MSNPAKEFVRVKNLDTGHHFTVTRLVAERSDRLQILEDHSPVDKDGRVAAAKPHTTIARLVTKKTSRTKPEPAPDVQEPNAEDPANKADIS